MDRIFDTKHFVKTDQLLKLTNMKPTKIRNAKWMMGIAVLFLSVALVSWGHQPTGKYKQPVNDTTPRKKTMEGDRKVKDLDDVIDELDKADRELNGDKMAEKI